METPHASHLTNTKIQAKRLGFTPHYLDQLRSQGKGPPYIRIGRSIRYDPVAVDKWLAERTVRHNEPAPAPQPAPKPSTDLPAWLQPLGESMTRDQSNITGARS